MNTLLSVSHKEVPSTTAILGLLLKKELFKKGKQDPEFDP